MPSRLSKFCFLLMASATLAVPLASVAEAAPPKARQQEAKPPAKAARDPQIYLFRGLANVFSLGMDDMAKELNERGIANKVLNHANWPRVAADITAKYKADPKRTRPIVLVGHSLGANAVLVMAQQLARDGVPVDLVVTFDPTTAGPVAPGVRRYLNLYQSNNGWSSALDVPPGAGKRVVNSDVRKRDDIKATLSHFDIDKNRVLHQQVVAEIARLTGAKPKAASRAEAPSKAGAL
ncbi:alpha/beta hydrolase [Kaistia granuli]|uniref:alpha/beta hydrolase n=1 Tax=Kaistia granuli TaxID=363259 RepID=UPI00039D8393|nr:alpha/beta hydrolase [Kaistia granuli]